MADASEFIIKVLVQLVRNCLLECLVRLRGWAKIVSTASHKSRLSSKAHNNRHYSATADACIAADVSVCTRLRDCLRCLWLSSSASRCASPPLPVFMRVLPSRACRQHTVLRHRAASAASAATFVACNLQYLKKLK